MHKEFLPLYGSKTKTTMALAKLYQSLHGFGSMNVENDIQYSGYWPIHLLTSKQCFFQLLKQTSKFSFIFIIMFKT